MKQKYFANLLLHFLDYKLFSDVVLVLAARFQINLQHDQWFKKQGKVAKLQLPSRHILDHCDLGLNFAVDK